MTKEELEKEWQNELKEFIDFHSKKIENMTEGEAHRYIIENKVDEKIAEMQKKYQERYNNIKNNQGE